MKKEIAIEVSHLLTEKFSEETESFSGIFFNSSQVDLRKEKHFMSVSFMKLSRELSKEVLGDNIHFNFVNRFDELAALVRGQRISFSAKLLSPEERTLMRFTMWDLKNFQPNF